MVARYRRGHIHCIINKLPGQKQCSRKPLQIRGGWRRISTKHRISMPEGCPEDAVWHIRGGRSPGGTARSPLGHTASPSDSERENTMQISNMPCSVFAACRFAGGVGRGHHHRLLAGLLQREFHSIDRGHCPPPGDRQLCGGSGQLRRGAPEPQHGMGYQRGEQHHFGCFAEHRRGAHDDST